MPTSHFEDVIFGIYQNMVKLSFHKNGGSVKNVYRKVCDIYGQHNSPSEGSTKRTVGIFSSKWFNTR